ncbi:Hypothetical predicted protein [Pelobates cultripes]|uniref:Uncharacterized protein n=1 Tax=Pelobates cultripes TaxID=61616 RepID=A0AAD1W000_PELCU|nr:Hypothetical predicted protein [Pelobates cultripes]
MTPLSDDQSYSSSEAFLADVGELDMLPYRRRDNLPAKCVGDQLETKGALKALLDDLRCNIAAAINSSKEEIMR